MGLRHKSIRLRVLLLVVIPIIALIGLYAVSATITARAAVGLARAKAVKDLIAFPDTRLQNQLDKERQLALLYLADPTQQAMVAYNHQQTATNKAVRSFRHIAASGSLASKASPREKRYADQLIKATDGLPALRGWVAATSISRAGALSKYSDIVTAGYRLLEGAAQEFTNVPLVNESLNLFNLEESYQLLLQESDLYASDLAAGTFPPADRAQFAELVGAREFLLRDTLPKLTGVDQAAYARFVPTGSEVTVRQLENRIVHGRAMRGLPGVPPTAWTDSVSAYAAGLGQTVTYAANLAARHATSQSQSAYLELYLAGGLGLLAIIASVLFSVLIGRGLIRQLAELRQSALELANDRLPSVMARLRDGEQVDVAAEAPPVESSADEIDQVRQAFHIVQRTAIEAAVDEATLRRGVSDVFRNLARRSQVLLHRQLRLLDGMERRASEPEELEDLFRIDHLTTRMRRHAEGLIILSGESPGRTWRTPVPLMDVLRAAVAEVEDYTRIRVESRTRAALAGQAVADVIHLIAELAENATIFSPPNTPVRITGDTVGRGFAVEVEDRGLGITEERLAEINKNLSSPPAFDLSGSDRLGLFIAGRLAARHDISIILRPSPYGGTTAIVIIPQKLLVTEDERIPAIGNEPRGLLAGRHAALGDGHGHGHGNGNGNGNGNSAPASPAGHASIGVDDADEIWAPRRLTSAAPPAAEPTAPGMPTVPTPRQSATASVTALPSAEEPGGWWTRSAPAQPFQNDIATVAGGDDRPAADDRGAGAAVADVGELGLPVRVRQANLAPQLRDAARTPGQATADEAPQPSAEAARSTMSALQRGWELGRSTADDAPADASAAQPASENGSGDEKAPDGTEQ
jgi:signal transduction histidine kinase